MLCGGRGGRRAMEDAWGAGGVVGAMLVTASQSRRSVCSPLDERSDLLPSVGAPSSAQAAVQQQTLRASAAGRVLRRGWVGLGERERVDCVRIHV